LASIPQAAMNRHALVRNDPRPDQLVRIVGVLLQDRELPVLAQQPQIDNQQGRHNNKRRAARVDEDETQPVDRLDLTRGHSSAPAAIDPKTKTAVQADGMDHLSAGSFRKAEFNKRAHTAGQPFHSLIAPERSSEGRKKKNCLGRKKKCAFLISNCTTAGLPTLTWQTGLARRRATGMLLLHKYQSSGEEDDLAGWRRQRRMHLLALTRCHHRARPSTFRAPR